MQKREGHRIHHPGLALQRKHPHPQKTPPILYTTTSRCTKILDSMEQACAVDNEAFIVTSQISKFSPTVEETFYNEEDAVNYAQIMQRNKPNRKYRVYHAIA